MKHFVHLFTFLSTSIFAAESTYQFGHGLQIGNLPLYIGGYSSLEYNDVSKGEKTLKLDELALMVYGEYGRVSYMFETEVEDVYTEVFGNESAETQHDSFHIERLYINYDFNENHSLKIGKYSSPIGFWNISPINVLRATTSDPIITSKLFPLFTSGLAFQYQTFNDMSVTYTGIFQYNKDIDKLLHEDAYNNFDTDRHYGLGVSFQSDRTTYQFNAGYFHLPGNESYRYIAGSFLTELPEDTIQGEIGTQFLDGQCSLPYVGYLQWVHTLKTHHESIVRVESYHDRIRNTDDTFLVMGYTYRPYYPVAFKAEYQWHAQDEENQLLLSLSVLF